MTQTSPQLPLPADAPTSYDSIAYPSTVFPATHPDHLAMVARLHRLAAPPVATARVLEIGGGDGVNVIAMAAAYPQASFLSFDLSATAVARGRTLAATAGLDNVRIEVGDILAAAAGLDGSFDYVIAHGVYAWVPAPVRQAIMTLIGRVLAPEGIAFVSYNALPGGYLRHAVRDMLLHNVGHITDPVLRIDSARALLTQFAAPRAADRPVLAAMREVARPMLRKNAGTLYHDELSSEYSPMSLSEVVADSAVAGLGFLNDASAAMIEDAFPGEDRDEVAVVALAQASDYANVVFFRQTLLIHAGRQPARTFDPAALAALYIAARWRRSGPETFAAAEGEFTVGDVELADRLDALAQLWPFRQRVDAVADTPDRREAIYRLFERELLTLHTGPLPGVREPGERPLGSPVARGQIALGMPTLFTLDLRVTEMTAAGPRVFLSLLNGSRDKAQIAAAWAESPYGAEVDADTALRQLAAAALISR
jgi:SAM-dependent methyltransferase